MESQEFEKILQLALFVIDDKAEMKSKANIQLRVNQGIQATTRCEIASNGEISGR